MRPNFGRGHGNSGVRRRPRRPRRRSGTSIPSCYALHETTRRLPMTEHLSDAQFADVVRLAPLVSIDLVIRDPDGDVLVGLRTNAPAKGFWFVPGGRIRKNE